MTLIKPENLTLCVKCGRLAASRYSILHLCRSCRDIEWHLQKRAATAKKCSCGADIWYNSTQCRAYASRANLAKSSGVSRLNRAKPVITTPVITTPVITTPATQRFCGRNCQCSMCQSIREAAKRAVKWIKADKLTYPNISEWTIDD